MEGGVVTIKKKTVKTNKPKPKGVAKDSGGDTDSSKYNGTSKPPKGKKRRQPKPKVPKQFSILGARKLDESEEKTKDKELKIQVVKREGPLSVAPYVEPVPPISTVEPNDLVSATTAPKIWSTLTDTQRGKLLTEDLGFCESEFTRNQSDNSQYRVVGVLGAQGVGKTSFMLNLKEALSPEAASNNREEPKYDEFFQVQTEEERASLTHKTRGIDGCFVKTMTERLLLLDSQPLLSPSVCVDLFRKNAEIPHGLDSYMEMATLQSLQLVILMLTVCHSVVIIQEKDTSSDETQIHGELWRLLRLALMIKSESVSRAKDAEHSADLLLLTDNQDLQQVWKLYFSDIVPHTQARPRVDVLSTDKRAVLELLKYTSPSFEAGIVVPKSKKKIQDPKAETLPARQLSEKEWFMRTRKLWSNLKESKTIDDFKHLLHQSEINIL